MSELLSGLTEVELLAQLPDSVASTLADLEKAGISWDEAGEMLAETPDTGVVPRGGFRRTQDLWAKVKVECRDFLCTDSATYKDLRDQLSTQGLVSGAALKLIIDAVTSNLGLEAGVLYPLVIWCLVVVCRIGKEAFCKSLAAPPGAP